MELGYGPTQTLCTARTQRTRRPLGNSPFGPDKVTVGLWNPESEHKVWAMGCAHWHHRNPLLAGGWRATASGLQARMFAITSQLFHFSINGCRTITTISKGSTALYRTVTCSFENKNQTTKAALNDTSCGTANPVECTLNYPNGLQT